MNEYNNTISRHDILNIAYSTNPEIVVVGIKAEISIYLIATHNLNKSSSGSVNNIGIVL